MFSKCWLLYNIGGHGIARNFWKRGLKCLEYCGWRMIQWLGLDWLLMLRLAPNAPMIEFNLFNKVSIVVSLSTSSSSNTLSTSPLRWWSLLELDWLGKQDLAKVSIVSCSQRGLNPFQMHGSTWCLLPITSLVGKQEWVPLTVLMGIGIELNLIEASI